MQLRRLSIEGVEYVAHALAQETMGWEEAIPAFGTRFKNILEGCIASPFQAFGGKQMYPGLLKKASRSCFI